MKNAENPLLSISLLASDRLDTIPRCLDSLEAIREAIPCELIVVDTSNNPAVRECLLKYTDKIETFEWCNDFSKARNVGMKKCKGEWFMFLDDDEWFLDSEPLITFFQSGEYKEYGGAHYIVHNFTDETFTFYNEAWVKRLTKLDADTQFYSKVHEYLAPSVGKNKALEAIVGHSGYVFKDRDAEQKHFERNTSLLEKMESEEPDSFRWKLQYIQEYRSMNDWENLEKYCKKSIDYLHKQTYNVNFKDISQIYIGYIHALVSQNKYEEAIDYYKRIKRANVFQKFITLSAVLDVLMAKAYYKVEDFESMYEHAMSYMSLYDIYQKNPRDYTHEEIGSVYATAFTELLYDIANVFLVYGKLKFAEYEDIEKCYRDSLWMTADSELRTLILIESLDAYASLQDEEMLMKIVLESFQFTNMKQNLVKWLLYKGEDSQIYQTIMGILKETNVWKWYDLYGELAKIYTEITTKDVIDLGCRFVNEVPNVFQIPDVVKKVFKAQGVELESLYKELDFMIWKKQLIEHFDCINMDQLDVLKDTLEKSSLNGDVRFSYFMMLYAEQKLMHIKEREESFEYYNELLYTFSEYTCATYETLYAEEIPNMELDQLPNNYQAALWLKEYFEEVGTNIKIALPCLSKVIEVYPLFQDVIKSYLECLKQEMFE